MNIYGSCPISITETNTQINFFCTYEIEGAVSQGY